MSGPGRRACVEELPPMPRSRRRRRPGHTAPGFPFSWSPWPPDRGPPSQPASAPSCPLAPPSPPVPGRLAGRPGSEAGDQLGPGWGPGGSTLPGERPALSWPLGLYPRPVPPPGAPCGRKAWEAGGPRPVNPQTRSIRKEHGPGSEWGKRKNQRTFGLWKRLERPGKAWKGLDLGHSV